MSGQVTGVLKDKQDVWADPGQAGGPFSRICSEVSVWCQMFPRVPIESNDYNTCPKDMKLNQSGQDMSLLVVIQFWGNSGSNKQVTFYLPVWYFCH